MASKAYNDNSKLWYKEDLLDLLTEMLGGKLMYTHHFEFPFKDGRNHYQFVGKDNRPHLRKCLWTLEADGLIENINLGNNVHQWKITEKGENYLINHIFG